VLVFFVCWPATFTCVVSGGGFATTRILDYAIISSMTMEIE
jgi:hypothetical protein